MKRDKQNYTPMMQQYLTIKEDYNGAIVFFRLGDFYEMFFEDALLASKELEIQLTARDAGAKDKVPMCGVPHHSSESYINRLVEKGYKVAICEQVEEAKKGIKLVKRDVVRVITPGTNIDDLDATEHFIASVGLSDNFYTISYLNISTGEANALKVPKDINALINELSTIVLKEIIIAHPLDQPYLKQYTEHENIMLSMHKNTELDPMFHELYKHLPTKDEQKTSARLINYILKTQKRTLMHLKPFKHVEASATMKMDANTIRNLELVKTIRQNQEHGSLFWLLNHTSTAMGARYLKQQLLRPLVNKEILNTRYDFIDSLNKEFITKSELKETLKSVYDLERIVGRISYGNTNGKDLIQLRKSLDILPSFKTLLSNLNLTYASFLKDSIDSLETLNTILHKALLEDQPLSIKEGNMFKEGYDEALDELKDIHLNIKTYLETLEKSEQEKTGIKKLKIGYNRVFGYYIEVPKGQITNIKDSFNYTRKQTLANAERYITEELKEKEKVILSSEEKSVQLEYELFTNLRETVKEYLGVIQKNAEIISEVDMFIALSIASEKYELIRPTLTDDHQVEILEGKHPVVEQVLELEQFIPNDILMDASTNILLITGPNMSGKSTYMRQLALTAILAQIGSFVPAKKAVLPIFDQLFTRIGATDDLISGKSTFMVEMLDANHAIKHASKHSLILFDEIGRGTSTYDGLAIAQAIIEYIHENIGAKTLFSTHYHELTDLENHLNTLKNVHVSAKEKDGEIIFHHLVKPGKADKSYGINVASLAHLPKSLIKRSENILKTLETAHKEEPLNLFNYEALVEEEEPHPYETLIDEILTINPDQLTPIEALKTLYTLKEKAKNRK